MKDVIKTLTKNVVGIILISVGVVITAADNISLSMKQKDYSYSGNSAESK